jgi:hypothetical protein
MTESPAPSTHGTGNFLMQSTGGLPNWAWLLVIAGGIAAAIIVPKILPGKSSSPTTGSGLGLAIDPTTGLPYATEGLVPSGQTYSGGGTPPPPNTTGTPPPSTTTASVYTRNLQQGQQPPNDIPIWKTPNADWTQDVGAIPINTPIKVGAPVQTGTETFYPVTYNNTVGFVAGWDLAGVPTGQQWP